MCSFSNRERESNGLQINAAGVNESTAWMTPGRPQAHTAAASGQPQISKVEKVQQKVTTPTITQLGPQRWKRTNHPVTSSWVLLRAECKLKWQSCRQYILTCFSTICYAKPSIAVLPVKACTVLGMTVWYAENKLMYHLSAGEKDFLLMPRL